MSDYIKDLKKSLDDGVNHGTRMVAWSELLTKEGCLGYDSDIRDAADDWEKLARISIAASDLLDASRGEDHKSGVEAMERLETLLGWKLK